MKTILVTGGSGFLGSNILKLMPKKYKPVGLYNKNKPDMGCCEFIKSDITNAGEVFSLIRKVSPDAVIHAAALKNADYCEKNKQECRKLNVESTKNFAEACRQFGAKFIYISTDFVFDGNKGNYKETDMPNPINYYGITKLEGENITKNLPEDNYSIIRTSGLYGWNSEWQKTNFVTWVLDCLKKGQKVEAFADQLNTPTYVENCAEAVIKASTSNIAGLCHAAGSECIDRFEFAKKIAKKFDLDESLVLPAKIKDVKEISRRPRDSSLNTDKGRNQLKFRLLGTNEGLSEMKKQIRGGNK